MSYQGTQPAQYRESFQASNPHPRKRPGAAAQQQTTTAVVLTACFLFIALLYLMGQARLTTTEYRRQALFGQISRLEARNTALRFQINQLSEASRVAELAQASGMRRADPAAETDYIALAPPPETRTTPWRLRAERTVASAFTSLRLQLAASLSGRAEAGPVPSEHRP